MSSADQTFVAFLGAGFVVVAFCVAFTWWVARPFKPWTDEGRPDVPAE